MHLLLIYKHILFYLEGDVKNNGMIMGTNALAAFEFHISYSNGIEILPASSECFSKTAQQT